MNCEYCGKIIAIGTLTLFLTTFPLCAEPPMRESGGLSEAGTKFYSEAELNQAIDEVSAAAVKEIEAAAAESAKAASMAGLEREAAQLAEIARLEKQNGELKKSGFKKIVISGLVCFASGVLIGAVINN
jgi:hypothetical protein